MKIAVIGSGAWGTALALVASRTNNKVIIWSRNNNTCAEINQAQQNSYYLPNIDLPASITATTDLSAILSNDIFFLTVPAQNIRQLCVELASLKIDSDKIIVICSKGIEQNSFKLMSEVVAQILPHNPVAILSGPNFAYEVAQNLPAITSISSGDPKLNQTLIKALNNNNFRIYPNTDVIGTQIFGAAKNVLAIATGITIGKKFGENAKAAILSRGIYEINNLNLAKGGDAQTLFAPAGVGDIYLTCSSPTSRNTSYGITLATGSFDQNNSLVEGFYSAESIYLLAKSLNIEMPICEAVYQVTHQNYPIDEAIISLLHRPIKHVV